MQARPSPVFFHHVWKFVRRQQSSDTAAKSGIFDARGTHRLGRALGTATFFIAESATNATSSARSMLGLSSVSENQAHGALLCTLGSNY
jgi:hypothetical protein